jgi:hypothetical protein
MPYDNRKRLRLYGLVENLDDAVRTNDPKTAQYYRARLTRAIETAADDDPAKPLQVALIELFKTSGLWVRNADQRRADTKLQILRLTRRIIPLLTGTGARGGRR